MSHIIDASASGLDWRKSSFSGGNNNCVEVADGLHVVPVRDSKDPQGPALVFPAGAWSSFVDGVKGGSFGA